MHHLEMMQSMKFPTTAEQRAVENSMTEKQNEVLKNVEMSHLMTKPTK